MKIIIAGATGFLASELIRQSLHHPRVTSVVALARRPVAVPDPSDAAAADKLRSVLVSDYETYPDDVRREFAGADACIWTVAVTPLRSATMDWDEVKRICQTSTLAGLRAMHEAGPAPGFRFLYMSGIAASRDPAHRPLYKPEYSLMRGETENQVLAYAAEHGFQAAAAKPGMILKPGGHGNWAIKGLAAIASTVMPMGAADLGVIAAAVLNQAVDGIEKDPLMHDDLVRIGSAAIKELEGPSQ